MLKAPFDAGILLHCHIASPPGHIASAQRTRKNRAVVAAKVSAPQKYKKVREIDQKNR